MVVIMNRGVVKLFICFIVFAVSLPLWAKNTINSVRVWPSPDSTRVVFDLDDKPDFSYFMLKNPSRGVVGHEKNQRLKVFTRIHCKTKKVINQRE